MANLVRLKGGRIEGARKDTWIRIEGYVEHLIFRNSDNGYTVLVAVRDGDELTCVGVPCPVIGRRGAVRGRPGTIRNMPAYGTPVPDPESLDLKDTGRCRRSIERYLRFRCDQRDRNSLWQPGLCGGLKRTPSALWKKSRSGWRRVKGISERKGP